MSLKKSLQFWKTDFKSIKGKEGKISVVLGLTPKPISNYNAKKVNSSTERKQKKAKRRNRPSCLYALFLSSMEWEARMVKCKSWLVFEFLFVEEGDCHGADAGPLRNTASAAILTDRQRFDKVEKRGRVLAKVTKIRLKLYGSCCRLEAQDRALHTALSALSF